MSVMFLLVPGASLNALLTNRITHRLPLILGGNILAHVVIRIFLFLPPFRLPFSAVHSPWHDCQYRAHILLTCSPLLS